MFLAYWCPFERRPGILNTLKQEVLKDLLISDYLDEVKTWLLYRVAYFDKLTNNFIQVACSKFSIFVSIGWQVFAKTNCLNNPAHILLCNHTSWLADFSRLYPSPFSILCHRLTVRVIKLPTMRGSYPVHRSHTLSKSEEKKSKKNQTDLDSTTERER
jgi:hypothetical protein